MGKFTELDNYMNGLRIKYGSYGALVMLIIAIMFWVLYAIGVVYLTYKAFQFGGWHWALLIITIGIQPFLSQGWQIIMTLCALSTVIYISTII